MSSALLPAHTSHCSPVNKLSLSRVGRQQRVTPLTKRQPQRARTSVISNVATAPLPPPADISTPARPQQVLIPGFVVVAHVAAFPRTFQTMFTGFQETPDLSQKPPFTLNDLKRAIPRHCWQKNTAKSVSYLVKDVAIVAGLAVAAYSANTWCVFSHDSHCRDYLPGLQDPPLYLLHLLIFLPMLVYCCFRWAWPAYWLAQGTMFWALFVVGHDW